jgi:1-acyl-sn-glycerol-3-phosphate acyltransferase
MLKGNRSSGFGVAWRTGAPRLAHKVGVQGLQVVVGGLRKARVRKRRVQVAAVAADAFVHRALEGAEAPGADAGFGVGGQVCGGDAAERGLHSAAPALR